MAGPRHALSLRSEGQKSRSHGYEKVTRLRKPSRSHGCYWSMLLRPCAAAACRRGTARRTTARISTVHHHFICS